MKKGFTVLELLVVVAIIGLLAAVVTVFVNASRERARLAGAMQLEANILHGSGDQLIGEWVFDQANANDTSGNNRNGIVSGTGVTWDQTGGYNGKGAYVFNGGSIIAPIPANTTSGTISFWFKPSTVNQHGLFDSGDPGGLFLRGDAYGNLTFGLHTSGTVTYSNFITGANKWYLVTVTWNGSSLTIYKDGGGSPQTGSIGPLPLSLSYFGLGQDDTGAFIGTIDSVRFYNKVFTAMDVQKAYAESSASHVALQ